MLHLAKLIWITLINRVYDEFMHRIVKFCHPMILFYIFFKYGIFLSIVVISTLPAFGQAGSSRQGNGPGQSALLFSATMPPSMLSPRFEPNRGQVAGHDGKPVSRIKYIYKAPGMVMGLEKTGFSYVLYTVEQKETPPGNTPGLSPGIAERDRGFREKAEVRYHRVEVEFPGASDKVELLVTDKTGSYANYYLKHCRKGVTGINGYRTVIYKNLYPNIDLVLKTHQSPEGREILKYDIVVHPGGDLSRVRMRYKGMDGLELRNGILTLKTGPGTFTETIPAGIIPGTGDTVKVKYHLEGNTISFIREPGSPGPLIVDPILQWSTYLGGKRDERNNDLSVNDSGNVYITGMTYSSDFPVFGGPYQSSFGGYSDAYLCKFSNNGKPAWSTFLGGSNRDRGKGVASMGSNELFTAGITYSDSFPVTNGAYQTTEKSGSAYLCKFSDSGTLIWSTFLGGSGTDQGLAVATDDSGNAFLTGSTNSSDFPVTPGAYQNSQNAVSEVFVTKFSNNGKLRWSTYLGGINTEIGWDITSASNGDIFITGYTYSKDFPVTAGAYQTTLSKKIDVFLSKFSNNGTLLWSTYLGGKEKDRSSGVAADSAGNVFITGTTESPGFPVTAGAHRTKYGGGRSDAFLTRFSASGSLDWSTFLGDSAYDRGRDVTVRSNGNAIVTGFTASKYFPYTCGTFQVSSGGGSSDAFITEFHPNDSLVRSTYLGGDDSETGQSVETDKSGQVFVVGQTYSNNFPVTGNAWQNSKKGRSDLFLSKLDISVLQTEIAGFKTGNVCSGDPAVFTDTSRVDLYNKIDYKWHFGDGDSSGKQHPAHYYRYPGSYMATLELTMDDRCTDTARKVLFVIPKPAAKITADNVCYGDSMQFTGSNKLAGVSIDTFAWTFGDGDSSYRKSPVRFYRTSGKYTTRLILTSDSGCKDTAGTRVWVHARPSAKFNAQNVCSGDSMHFSGISGVDTGNIVTRKWEFGDGDSSYKVHPVHYYRAPGKYRVTLVVVTDSGCKDTAVKNRYVHSMPDAGFSVAGACLGDSMHFVNKTVPDSGRPYSYYWKFGDGDSSKSKEPLHYYRAPGDYSVTMVAVTGSGCKDSAQAGVAVYPVPVAGFRAGDVCFGDTVRFTDTSKIDSGSIIERRWNYGDGDSGRGINPVHNYRDSGIHYVSLVVTTSAGCRDSTRGSVDIYPLPEATFSFRLLGNRYVEFSPDDSILTRFHWEFGDGNSTTKTAPVHRYPQPDTFTVILSTTNRYGCTSQDSKLVVVSKSGIKGKDTRERPGLKVYPNPSGKSLIIRYKLPRPGNLTLILTGIPGKDKIILYSGRGKAGTNEYRLDHELRDLSPGIYLLRLVTGNTMITRKLVIQK